MIVFVSDQTCFWNAVLRAVVIFAGAVSFATSGIVVPLGAHVTDFLPRSLSVMTFQSVPPHCGPGAATRAPAGRAVAAVTVAATAAAARTNRILGPPRFVPTGPQLTEKIIGRRPDGQHARSGYPSFGSFTPRILRTTSNPMPAIQSARTSFGRLVSRSCW